jgi:Zn-dependent protease
LDPVGIAIQFAVLILSLSFHEAAHAWTANRLGDPTARMLGRLTLNPLAHIDWIGTVLFPLIAMLSNVPLLGWAKPVPVNMWHFKEPRRDFAIVAAAGPASNLLLSAAAALLFHLIAPQGLSSVSVQPEAQRIVLAVLEYIVWMNTLLAVFNMLPVPPLDGGNVLMGLVSEQGARAIAWLRPYGFLILYVLMFSGVLSRVVWPIAHALGSILL